MTQKEEELPAKKNKLLGFVPKKYVIEEFREHDGMVEMITKNCKNKRLDVVRQEIGERRKLFSENFENALKISKICGKNSWIAFMLVPEKVLKSADGDAIRIFCNDVKKIANLPDLEKTMKEKGTFYEIDRQKFMMIVNEGRENAIFIFQILNEENFKKINENEIKERCRDISFAIAMLPDRSGIRERVSNFFEKRSWLVNEELKIGEPHKFTFLGRLCGNESRERITLLEKMGDDFVKVIVNEFYECEGELDPSEKAVLAIKGQVGGYLRNLDAMHRFASKFGPKAVLKLYGEYNITFFHRYTPNQLEELYTKIGKKPAKMPALIFFNKYDWGAFYPNEFDPYRRNRYRSIFEKTDAYAFEGKNEDEFYACVKKIGEDYGKITVLLIVGHGENGLLALGKENATEGPKNNEKMNIDVNDMNEFAESVSPYLSENPYIILEACNGEELGRAISTAIPKATVKVSVGEVVETNINVRTNEENDILDVDVKFEYMNKIKGNQTLTFKAGVLQEFK